MSAESSSEGVQQQPASQRRGSIWADRWTNTEKVGVSAASEEQKQHSLLLSAFPSAITDFFFFFFTQRQVTLDGKICTFKVKYVVTACPADQERKDEHVE